MSFSPEDAKTSDPMATPAPTRTGRDLQRGALLLLVILAFTRVAWALDMKNLWWDESLSLQRAESNWPELLSGALYITDTFTQVPTIDQHPFFFFAVIGVLVRLAGNSEFVLRFPSVVAATLLVPTAWAFARLMVRRAVLPRTAPLWAALFAAISPFFLWYGQEARPYALWAWLALLSTYLLLRSTESPEGHAPSRRWAWWLGYGVTLLLFLTTHYFAVFLLPLHILILGAWLLRRSRWLAVLITGGIVALVGIIGCWAAFVLLVGSSGANFNRVPVRILLVDLLNAFSLGLSVDIGVRYVWWLDLLYGAIALIGAIWAVRSWRSIRSGGWVLIALLVVPVALLLVAGLIRPAYMNARHMSLLGGPFALLLGGGLGFLWARQRWVAGALALIMVAGAGYSTVNYFTAHEYNKKYDDFAALGRLIERRMVPGDLLILNPAASWRIFRYYLPLDAIDAGAQAADLENGLPAATYYGVPLLNRPWSDTYTKLQESKEQHRRIWLIYSGTHPYMDLENQIQAWLDDNLYKLQEYKFFSQSELRAHLYVPEPPVYNEPIDIPGTPLDVTFGDQIRLVGYDVGTPIVPESAIPVTLTWRTLSETDVPYKYILQLVETLPDGASHVLATTEREPYDGTISTIYWHPQQTIVEYTEWPPLPERIPASADGSLQVRVQLYRADTLEKQPITHAQISDLPGAAVDADGVTLILPYPHQGNAP